MIKGNGQYLRKVEGHPYIGRKALAVPGARARIFKKVNKGRGCKDEAVEAVYYLTARSKGTSFEGIEEAVGMLLVHATTELWPGPGREPSRYRSHMSWLADISFLGLNTVEGMESALVTIATPLDFFDTETGGVSLTPLRMATVVEPFNALLDFTARLVDYRFPASFRKKFPGQVWSHRRIRSYLGIGGAEPIIGTIVKPKWLPPELFARSVVEAAVAGALFIKSDENLHMTLKEVPVYVKTTITMLEREGFDFSSSAAKGKKRVLFAPHISVNPPALLDFAKAAVDNGANALMFSPYLSGDFGMIEKIFDLGAKYRVPVYAHTAGMNRFTGDPSFTFGEDARVEYLLAALSGAAFMQLPALRGYIRPADEEKPAIVRRLEEEGVTGPDGMTLAIAGGLGAKNIGFNIKAFGAEGKMFLAGTSVYHHPDGVFAGIKALKQAVAAARKNIVEPDTLKRYAAGLGEEGRPLLRALG